MDVREVALLRLAAQGLLGPGAERPRDAVAHLLAVQAQDLPGAWASVALRTAGRDVAAVRADQDAGLVVRTWPMRGTLHLVPAEDAAWLVELCAGRQLAAAARRRVQLGLEPAAVRRAEDVAQEVLRGDGLTREELLARWETAGVPVEGGLGYHLLAHLAQVGLACLGPTQGRGDRVVLLAEWVPRPRRPSREEALAEVALRYLRGHGPATVADLQRWTGLTLRDVRAGVADVRDRLETVVVDGVEHLLDPATPQVLDRYREQARAVRLLPGFDEVVLGYADRTATVPAEHAGRVVPGNNGVFRGTVLRDGRAVGTWRREGSGARRRLVAEPFAVPFDDAVAADVDAAARAVAALY